MTTPAGAGTSQGAMPAGPPDPASAAPFLNGILWGLALVLVGQAAFGFAIPGLLDLATARWLGLWGACRAGACELTALPFLPWAVFAALHLVQARHLRRYGAFPFSDGQILGLALLPGYNLTGSVALFTAEGEALERLGAGRGLARQLRLGAAVANGLAVVRALWLLRGLRLDLSGAAPGAVSTWSVFLWLTVALLAVRLFVLARLQVANHRLKTPLVTPATAPPPSPVLAALLAPRLTAGVAAVALAAGGLTVLQTARRGQVPGPFGPAPHGEEAGWPDFDAPPAARPRPAGASATAPMTARAVAAATPSAAAPAAAAPAAVRVTAPAPEPLYAGRDVAWWTERLQALRQRTDPQGMELFALTSGRAEANGLRVVEEQGRIRVQAGQAPAGPGGAAP